MASIFSIECLESAVAVLLRSAVTAVVIWDASPHVVAKQLIVAAPRNQLAVAKPLVVVQLSLLVAAKPLLAAAPPNLLAAAK